MAVSVISPRFCFPGSVDLAISEKVWQIIGSGDFIINDVNGNRMFKVKRIPFSFHHRMVMFDAASTPIVTLRKKANSGRDGWQVFRGESSAQRDLIFSARRSSTFQMKTKLHVFLANNVSEDFCDYAVQGNLFESSCKVYVGDSSTMIAQMHKNSSIGSSSTGKNRLKVGVYPNVDHASITVLMIILDEITSSSACA